MRTLTSTVINTYLHVKLKGMIQNCMCSVHSLIHSFVQSNTVCLYGRYCARPRAPSYEPRRQESLPTRSLYSSDRRHNKQIDGHSDKSYGIYSWVPHSKDINIQAYLKESRQKGEGVWRNVKKNWKEMGWCSMHRL